ncbi:MAG: tRNA dimethylallyltransferase [Candidatus Daviesbacteria bacterium GW2011_GWA1_41_61]|uniref:tRNA dimethylallyltransferase n=1 Tax=Candidatus Daviesbacteria bacterium GW2011_GWA2_40_9 TaxID=1618424 RepID=A0A0G0X4F0_9BACT|nr:MAG: tRNA dimethylallyltransferase [Candidatus Daviesbacteria bacterium GW2011_GWC1_40_9]KKR82487.1 MAG: tRNA dimethylallyltransferase [Candidatus Daviesbacteria bacterium GW2011_GWA2_40_9]KKR93154.1 MAG: tRNA dimethylallyltransferase [Candidatus Daviesbacteria bacterium GW2011_GWB1_41_15]KKS15698.1 MAG: tRNA dimethylallyltransferase [Candidatus Daviesbacteria bacterium GW2011_GWA1_41_61]
MDKHKLLVILGPTATGKTDLALSLAKKFSGELISADSRQVYKGLDIGTGKLPGREVEVKRGDGFWEMDGTKVWMYDVVNPKQQFTVKDYVLQAGKIVEDVIKRGRLPIVVGGTGFYVKGLLEGFASLDIPMDENLRGELQKLSLKELQQKLQSLSPTKWASLNQSDKKNPRRILRSIEIIYTYPYRKTNKKLKIKSKKWNMLKIGLTAPRPVLYERIDLRLLSRIQQGLIEEGENLHEKGLSLQRMKELGLEYGMMADLLSGVLSNEQFTTQLQTKIHQYAKRQMTWFQKEPDIHWFDITTLTYHEKVENLVDSWYYPGDDKKD